MKITVHVPTESFGFVSAEFEAAVPQEIKEIYDDISNAFKPPTLGEGLERKEFETFLDKYMCGESIHIEDYNKMNEEQQRLIQTLKRSKARISNRLKKQQ